MAPVELNVLRSGNLVGWILRHPARLSRSTRVITTLTVWQCVTQAQQEIGDPNRPGRPPVTEEVRTLLALDD